MNEIIAFTTYESPWFPAGGIAAVMGELPSAVEDAAKLPTAVVTPLHFKSPKLAALQKERLKDVTVQYDGADVLVTIFHCETEKCHWYFLQPADNPSDVQSAFFGGERHPYDVPKETLLQDSLFFGAAVVQALPAIAEHLGIAPETAEWNLFAQDWEGATAALAFASQDLYRGRLHITCIIATMNSPRCLT